MHQERWTTVNVNIQLLCDTRSLHVIFRLPAIIPSFCLSNGGPQDLSNEWIPDVKDHCTDDSVTEYLEPVLIEISIISTLENFGKDALPFTISIAQ